MSKAFQNQRKRVWHENMKHRRGEKRKGKGEKRERGRMELNIGVEFGRFREYIYRLRTFCKRALDDHHSVGKPPVMGALGPLRLTSSQEEFLPYLTLLQTKHITPQTTPPAGYYNKAQTD
eukprot:6174445-Pleurochrysis_carterae.AAC.5